MKKMGRMTRDMYVPILVRTHRNSGTHYMHFCGHCYQDQGHLELLASSRSKVWRSIGAKKLMLFTIDLIGRRQDIQYLLLLYTSYSSSDVDAQSFDCLGTFYQLINAHSVFVFIFNIFFVCLFIFPRLVCCCVIIDLGYKFCQLVFLH